MTYQIEIPVAAIIRENEFLREVAAAAIKLRRIGVALDNLEEAQEQAIKATNGIMSRSGTGQMMYELAFKTAMDEFDKAVLRAAEAHMDWARVEA